MHPQPVHIYTWIEEKNPHCNILNKQIVHSASQALITEWKIDWTWIRTPTEGNKKISADLHNNIFYV